MTSKHTAVTLLGLWMAGAVTAHSQEPTAQPFSYDYAHASYAASDLSSGGYELGAAIEVARNIHAFTAYQDWKIRNNWDRSTFQVGAGHRWGISPTADVVAHLAYADTRIRRPGPNLSNDGFIVGGTVRSWAGRNLELSGSVLLDGSVRSGTDAVLEFGGQYYINGAFSLGGRLRLDEDDSTLFIGGRYHFAGLNRGSR